MKYSIEFYNPNKYEGQSVNVLECLLSLKKKELNSLLENAEFEIPPFIYGDVIKLKTEINLINQILNK